MRRSCPAKSNSSRMSFSRTLGTSRSPMRPTQSPRDRQRLARKELANAAARMSKDEKLRVHHHPVSTTSRKQNSNVNEGSQTLFIDRNCSRRPLLAVCHCQRGLQHNERIRHGTEFSAPPK